MALDGHFEPFSLMSKHWAFLQASSKLEIGNSTCVAFLLSLVIYLIIGLALIWSS